MRPIWSPCLRLSFVMKGTGKLMLAGRVARFSSTQYTKIGKIYQRTTTLPNGHKIYQIAVKYCKRPKNIPTFSILRPSKIYPNFGLKIYHLAALLAGSPLLKCKKCSKISCLSITWHANCAFKFFRHFFRRKKSFFQLRWNLLDL
jgi:hypothetical protein